MPAPRPHGRIIKPRGISCRHRAVDDAARRLYVARATHVMVVDLETGKQVGDIPNTDGVHGITIAPEFGRGFTSNGRANNVTIFDLKTLKVLGTVPTGTNPDSIRYDPASKRVFALNARSKNSTVIEPASGKVLSTIALGGAPEFTAVDGKGKLYVNIADTNEVVELGRRIASRRPRSRVRGKNC
jgi:DNA-binding beta-propeller fold protein YncE